MILIRVRPKSYTRSELKKLFQHKYSTKDEDFEEWFSAMEITGQIERRGNRYFPTMISTEKKPMKKTIQIIPEINKTYAEKVKSISVFHWTKIPKINQDRIAIRAGEDWVKKEGIPSKIFINRIYKNGKWIELPKSEKKELYPRIPRNYKIEKYLREIPIPIVRKYGLTGKEPIEIVITETRKKYFGTLRLWGYIIQAMLSFGQTGEHKGDRDLELHGYDFSFETKGNIVEEFEKIGTKILDVARSWLQKYDEEYYIFLTYGVNEEETTPPDPVEGIGPEPVRNAPRRGQKIRFSDVKKGRIIAEATASLPKNWYEYNPDELANLFGFKKPEDDRIGEAHGYKGRRETYKKLKKRQITLDEILKKGKEGEGFKK